MASKCPDADVVSRLRELMVNLVLKRSYVYNDCAVSIEYIRDYLSVVLRTKAADIYIVGTTLECDMYLSPKLGEAV